MTVSVSDVLLVLIAILFPPAAAAILTGCSCALLISILLTILGYIPGHLYAFYLIYRKIQADERYGPSGYTYVSQGLYQPIGAPPQPHQHQHHQQQQHQQGYQQQVASGSELYAGQGQGQNSASAAPRDNKGAPPPYGAV